MDLTPQVSTYAVEDNAWLGSRHGTDSTESITLDLTTFNATQTSTGVVPSGCALGEITASSLYGPYDDTATDGRQTLVGHLLGDVRVNAGSAKAAGALFWHGSVKTSKLPFQAGQTGAGFVDANGQADVKGSIRYRTA